MTSENPQLTLELAKDGFPRMVLPALPHHVTQRGNRRERMFFEDGDYELYLDLLAEGRCVRASKYGRIA